MKRQPQIVHKKGNWHLFFIFVGVIIVAILYLKRGYDKSTTTSDGLEPINATAAQKLASLDALSITRLPVDDIRVLKTDTLLNVLSATYKESPEAIANATYVAHERLKNVGKEMTHVTILEQMTMITPTGISYKQAIIGYVNSVTK